MNFVAFSPSSLFYLQLSPGTFCMAYNRLISYRWWEIVYLHQVNLKYYLKVSTSITV